MMVDFQPDTVIALVAVLQWMRRKECGCSMNTQIQSSLVQNKILDIRKRTYKIAKPEKHNLFVSQLLQELVQKLHHLPLLLIVKHT